MNNFLALTYSFLLTFCPYDQVGIGQTKEFVDNATHVQYELGVTVFDLVHVYTGEETLQVANPNIFSWRPYTQSYWIGVEVYKTFFNDKLTLTAGVNHKCQHPVECWGVQSSNFNSARTEIYMKVSGKIPLF